MGARQRRARRVRAHAACPSLRRNVRRVGWRKREGKDKGKKTTTGLVPYVHHVVVQRYYMAYRHLRVRFYADVETVGYLVDCFYLRRRRQRRVVNRICGRLAVSLVKFSIDNAIDMDVDYQRVFIHISFRNGTPFGVVAVRVGDSVASVGDMVGIFPLFRK